MSNQSQFDPSLPKMPKRGINPQERIALQAQMTYLAYYGGAEWINRVLRRHPREHPEDYDYRREFAYSQRIVKRVTKFLTRTIQNDNYPVKRSFESYVELERIAERSTPSGKSLDGIWREAAKHALLGGISYVFIDRRALGPRLETELDLEQVEPGRVELSVLKGSQVRNIVLSSDGYISQCEIYTPGIDRDTIVRYFTTESEYEIQQSDADGDLLSSQIVPAGTPIYEVWEAIITEGGGRGPFRRVDSGENDMIVAPLIPLTFEGSIATDDIDSDLFGVTEIDRQVLNILSGMQSAFDLHIYPRIVMPMSTVDQFVEESERGGDGAKSPDITIGSAWALPYAQGDTPPQILEPSGVHVDVTLTYYDHLKNEAWEMAGVAGDPVSPDASGAAREWEFIDTNETHRNINAALERAEYQMWFLVALLKVIEAPLSFTDFQSQVSIQRPRSFTPTGGVTFDRVRGIIESQRFSELPPDVQGQIKADYIRLALNDLKTITEMEEITKRIQEYENEIEPTDNSSSEPDGGDGQPPNVDDPTDEPDDDNA